MFAHHLEDGIVMTGALSSLTLFSSWGTPTPTFHPIAGSLSVIKTCRALHPKALRMLDHNLTRARRLELSVGRWCKGLTYNNLRPLNGSRQRGGPQARSVFFEECFDAA